jgi:hypothetical protein
LKRWFVKAGEFVKKGGSGINNALQVVRLGRMEGYYIKPEQDYFKQEDLTSWKTCPPL